MPPLTLDQFITGVHRAAARRRTEQTKLFGPARQAVRIPQSSCPPDLVAELDTVAGVLVAAIRRGTPQSDEMKAKLRISV